MKAQNALTPAVHVNSTYSMSSLNVHRKTEPLTFQCLSAHYKKGKKHANA